MIYECKDHDTAVELLKKDYLLKTEDNLKQKIGEIVQDFITRGLYNSTACTGKQLQAHFDYIDSLIEHIIKSLEPSFANIPLGQFKEKLLTIVDEEYKKLVPFANSHLVTAGLAQPNILKGFEIQINDKKEKTRQSIETRFAILEKQEETLEPKPPEFLQKLLWILMYGRKYWWLLFLAVLVFSFLYILPRLNLFSKEHENIHPEAKTSGGSSQIKVKQPIEVVHNILPKDLDKNLIELRDSKKLRMLMS